MIYGKENGKRKCDIHLGRLLQFEYNIFKKCDFGLNIYKKKTLLNTSIERINRMSNFLTFILPKRPQNYNCSCLIAGKLHQSTCALVVLCNMLIIITEKSIFLVTHTILQY